MADLANAALLCNIPAFPHNMDDMADSVVREEPPTLHTALEGFTRDSYLSQANAKTSVNIDISIDNFPG